ncbi:hypothetical protein PUV54_03945 [Hyphococcus flavus]|uniref:Uncharacterized protein n=1 Tax=Hyphococcus flavus TaxID=1866326 RepID=A0AAE9ZG59_9PROT|nr:hypothetical protein [Hyphococcus flavus]WDI32343.1 hypothetical protein PUV54_03945 [Hyphococcus flavus]
MPLENGQESQEYVAFQEHDLKGYRLEKQDAPWLITVLIIGAVALFIVVTQGWESGREGNRLFVPLYFMPDTTNIAIDILMSFAVITALMERAVEVFIGSTRAIRRKLTTRHLEALNSLLEDRQNSYDAAKASGDSKAQSMESALLALKDRRNRVYHRLTSYRTGTRIRALSFSLLFGTLIALAGVRVISPLLDVPYAALSNIQWAALQIVDIAGTAGLIAGGTNGIHRLISNLGARTEPENPSELEVRTRPS